MGGNFFIDDACFSIFWRERWFSPFRIQCADVILGIVPIGLDSFIQAGVRWRKWNVESSTRVFSILLVFLCGVFSVALFITRVITPDKNQAGWSQSDQNYREVEKLLVSWGANPSSRVIVNNPPGYYLASNREAMVIPDGGVEMLIEVAKKFRGEYSGIGKQPCQWTG